MKKIIIFLTLCIFLVGCDIKNISDTNQAVENPLEETKQDITLRSFYTLETSDFIPNKLANYEEKALIRNIHEALYKIDKDGQLEPGLAENIEIIEKDGYLIYDIKLRDNVKFHNGKSLEPKDIQFSLLRFTGLLNNIDESQFENFKYWKKLFDGDPSQGFRKAKVEILGEYRIVLYLDDFYGEEITSSLLADAFIIPHDYPLEKQATEPVGLGPYSFTSIEDNGKITLTAFDDYYGEYPDIKTVEILKFDSKEDRNTAFENKQIDMLDSFPGRDKDENYTPICGDTYSLVFNMENDLYKDLEFRKALAMSVSKTKIQSQLFGQSGQLLNSPLSPFHKIENVGEIVSYNFEGARQFLEARPEFSEIQLNLSYLEEDFLARAMGEYIVEDMRGAGFIVNLNPVNWTNYKKAILEDKSFEMAIVRYSGDINPNKILDRFTTRADKNISNYYNLKYNDLINSEKENYSKLVEVINRDFPEFFIIDPGLSYVMADGFTTPTIYPYPFLDFASIKIK